MTTREHDAATSPGGTDGASARADDEWLLTLYTSFAGDSRAWRRRIDMTANWAIPLVIAVSTFALGEPRLPHAMLLLLGGALVCIALVTDARRYRSVAQTAWRARVLEAGYLAPRLAGSAPADAAWRDSLAEDLRSPSLRLSLAGAIGARLRTTYLALAYVLVAAWLIKAVVHPSLAHSLPQAIARFAVGPIPGSAVLLLVLSGSVGAAVVALRSPSMTAIEHECVEQRPSRRPTAPAHAVA